MTESDNTRLQEFKARGYTVFEQVYDEQTMQTWRDEIIHLEKVSAGIHAQSRSWWFGNMLERAPALMWPALNNTLILDFAEQVVGPFVQLDNLTLAAFPPLSDAESQGQVSKWHRDRWAHMPTGSYQRPLSMNAICYLQDLTEEFGPLRVIPGSHIDPIRVTDDEIAQPHPDELVIHMKAGDVVLTHSGLLHSGTSNRSGKRRFFFSVYYNITWLRQTDTFGGPNCQQLISQARDQNDHRALRLLGVDEHLQARANSGFREPDELRWREWRAEDREALKVPEED